MEFRRESTSGDFFEFRDECQRFFEASIEVVSFKRDPDGCGRVRTKESSERWNKEAAREENVYPIHGWFAEFSNDKGCEHGDHKQRHSPVFVFQIIEPCWTERSPESELLLRIQLGQTVDTIGRNRGGEIISLKFDV